MLPTNLTTNEVKNASGTEVEFLRKDADGVSVLFAQSGEPYNLPHRLKVSHEESGQGVNLKRRTLIDVTKTVLGVDGTPVQIRTYSVTVIPVGNLNATTEVKNVLAERMSFEASTGATTTILYDCTGYGADAIVNGSY